MLYVIITRNSCTHIHLAVAVIGNINMQLFETAYARKKLLLHTSTADIKLRY